MSVSKGSYFRIGVFVLTGVGILLATIIIIGGAAIFQKTIPAETYFNESVQGLDIGAPVKYRGVSLGRVSNIGFISNKYRNKENSQSSRYVLVEMELREDLMQDFLSMKQMRKRLQQIVEKGLRVRLTTQGLTGVAFLEINFFDPKTNPPLPITWEPESMYFPSAPSTMSRLEAALDAVGGVMRDLEKVNFAGFAQTLDDFITTLDNSLKEANVKDIGELLVQSLAELRDTLKRVHTLVNNPKADSIIPDTSATMASARSIVETGEGRIGKAFVAIEEAATNIQRVSVNLDTLLGDPALAKSAQKLPETLANVNDASKDIRRSAAELDRLLRGLNSVLQGQSGNVGAIVEDTRTAIQKFNDLLEDINKQPSRLLFSEPPKHINPEHLP